MISDILPITAYSLCSVGLIIYVWEGCVSLGLHGLAPVLQWGNQVGGWAQQSRQSQNSLDKIFLYN